MKRFVVVENPPKSRRSVPAFRPVVFTRGAGTRGSGVRRNVMPMAATTSLNGSGLRIGNDFRSRTRKRKGPVGWSRKSGRLTARQASRLSHGKCLASGVRGAKCRTRSTKRSLRRSTRDRRRAGGIRGREVQAHKRALTGYGGSMGSFQTNPRRGRRRKFKRKSASGSRARNRRRGNANAGGSRMATTRKRTRRAFVAKRNSRKSKGRRVRRNKRGRPLSGRSYRPTLSKGPLRVIVKQVKAKYKKATSRKRRKTTKGRRKGGSRKRSRAKRNPVYTVFNGRKRGRKLSAGRARAMSMKRWHGKGRKNKGGRRRARRNFGGGIVSALKSALSVKTAKSGLAVLVGAIVATGAPSLFGTWNSGWAGIGLSILTAAGAAAAATFVAPAFLTEVASGGIVVVGLRLVAQFVPKALSWQSALKGTAAGFLIPANGSGRSGVGGYLPPPPGAVSLVGRGRVSGFARAAGEGFKSPRI